MSLLSTSGTPVVSCRQLRKNFGSGENQVQALRGINLDIYPGELMMLVGPSGCGKTTLISVIAGILDASAGECQVLGENLLTLASAARTQWRGKQIGFVFQAYNLLPTLTAAENVAIPLLVQKLPRSQALKQAAEMLQRVGLAERIQALPAQLSGGQQQRVAIARALVHQPPLLVCDEPTSALDHHTGHQVMELLRRVATSANRSLIVVTHDARIFPFADRIAHIEDGLITHIAENSPALIKESLHVA
ncbi:ABC transporter ATP-binding protein [Candidatus Magnetaquicoccus inordinatus]|uniref:ABC transporter ATP-binding protein n=1 Tax=Candidatus Magnetaquicoccus inordinatus TaxID=2496818 RepID=UPI00102B4299|nr:ABC transporter ATP-binding protein [Candidatus Magnetaquicoccus inordinatus]